MNQIETIRLEFERIRVTRQFTEDDLKIQIHYDHEFDRVLAYFERELAFRTLRSTPIMISFTVYANWWESLKAEINRKWNTRFHVRTRVEYVERQLDFRLNFPDFKRPPESLGRFNKEVKIYTLEKEQSNAHS